MEGSQTRSRVVGAVIGALAAATLGGVGLAWAQESPTTTAPPATEAPAPDSTQPDSTPPDTARPEGCDKDRAPGPGSSTDDGADTGAV